VTLGITNVGLTFYQGKSNLDKYLILILSKDFFSSKIYSRDFQIINNLQLLQNWNNQDKKVIYS